ncbi:phage integrase SAM-like domain-containing protein [Spirosoma sp.]|uniref:tyrosine-type recombinase/integrase n=1 Tax=Spirosoma sp. TaxID=1899569 RepID=UPI002630277E|nr:phage integrase SAM-like domain-containing protein [Spirosoma sp.]MCX6218346.1 phage integrase SAM-like domain-containing protein [Spirosoma sp.]
MRNLPTTAPKTLLTKRRLPISIRFCQRKGYSTIQIRISVNGDEGSAFSTLADGTSLTTANISWNQVQQRAVDRSNEARRFNGILDATRAKINDVYDRQVAMGFSPTPKSVKEEYQTGKPFTLEDSPKAQKWSAVNCYATYLNELQSGGFPEKELKKTTLDKWGYGLTYLQAYIAKTQVDEPLSIGPADELTVFWVKSYHRWLMKTGPMSADAATRYVNRLVEAINYIVESGRLKHNPLANQKLPRDKTKDVYFLDHEHLNRFWQLDLPGKAGVACWWMGVIFLTGLDYCDAVRYVENRALYERTNQWGDKKIVISRSKPPFAECHIPVLPALESLLATRPTSEIPQDWEINREMYAVATLIGFQRRLTCKIGRKTAGAIFYSEYEDIGAVSRMLGHSSVTITERYYVKTTGHTVDKAMQKRHVNTVTYQPFRRVA